MLKLKDDYSVELDFGQSLADEREAAPVDFSAKHPLGKCPKCGASVFDHELAYVCEKSVGPARTCDFRTGKIILQRTIEPEQVAKLLAAGKTDLLHKFISKKGRPFSAFLARQPDGRIGFEFAPRQGAPKAKGAAPTARKAEEPPPAAAPKAQGRTARDAATEKRIYVPKPAKMPASRAQPAAARAASKRAGAAKKTARKVPAKKLAPKKRAA
jgi:DNA topoisomerase-3